ncbi:hypothetical protein O181_049331 [Austropuccinia psidii MF-1]|uniref:Uncharacterized protein n=1 Tax=Austropuccinia psidii MF-1 TaxID=1389203 RepID=A0A9Q3DZP5_9BASI|nr:hypothetical protein [Austropuccinia psidii MF-1]
MDKPSLSKLPSSIEEIQEENLDEETVERQEEMASTDRLEMQEQLLAIIKSTEKINHQVILHKIVLLKNRPPLQDHSGHMDHLHLT